MTATPETFQAAWIESLKSKPTIIALLPNAKEIREAEWQGTDFQYPAIRVSLEFIPTIPYCGHEDANVFIEVFSAEKSSKQAVHITSEIFQLYHGHPFKAANVFFSTVVVRKIDKPEMSIFGWRSTVHIFCQGA